MAAPSTPANLSIDKVFSNAIELSWDASGGADGYYLYYSLDDVTYYKFLTTTALVGVHFYLDESTQYYYKVSAYNGDGESSLSSSVNDTTLVAFSDNVKGAAALQGPHTFDPRGAIIIDGVAYPNRGIYTGVGRIAYLESTAGFFSGGIVIMDLPEAGIPTESDVYEVEGNWRLIPSGNDLVWQRYESGTWTTKSTISA